MNLVAREACRATGDKGVIRSVTWFASVHVLALVGFWYAYAYFDGRTLALSIALYFACHLSITAGNHRLFCHRTYKAHRALEALFLFFTAATVQKSTAWWASMHRDHHAYSDTDRDPYSTVHGFWWADIVWIVFSNDVIDWRKIQDLAANRLVVFEDRFYYPIAVSTAFAFPTALGALWGDAFGGLLVGGFARLAFQYHFTFCINSLLHWGRHKPHGTFGTACVNRWLAFPTVGESFHQPHHIAEDDYRLGRRWYDPDPGKWLIFLCSKIGLATSLKRVSSAEFDRRIARLQAVVLPKAA